MNLTKRSKIIFIVISVVLLVVILSTFAALGEMLDAVNQKHNLAECFSQQEK